MFLHIKKIIQKKKYFMHVISEIKKKKSISKYIKSIKISNIYQSIGSSHKSPYQPTKRFKS